MFSLMREKSRPGFARRYALYGPVNHAFEEMVRAMCARTYFSNNSLGLRHNFCFDFLICCFLFGFPPRQNQSRSRAAARSHICNCIRASAVRFNVTILMPLFVFLSSTHAYNTGSLYFPFFLLRCLPINF